MRIESKSTEEFTGIIVSGTGEGKLKLSLLGKTLWK